MQISTVKIIIELKNKIFRSNDWNDIVFLTQQALNIGRKATAFHYVRFKNESKINVIKRLEREIEWAKKMSYPNIKTVKFQVACSLVSLAMVFVEGGIDDVNEIMDHSYRPLHSSVKN